MALPNKADLLNLDIAYRGQPFAHVATRDGLSDLAYGGFPFFVAPISDGAAPSAATDSPDVLVAAGEVLVSGALARTDEADVSAALSGVLVVGSLAVTEVSDSLSASGVAQATASLAVAEQPDHIAAGATALVGGSLALTDPTDAFAATGLVTVSGALVATDPADASAASATGGPTVKWVTAHGDTVILTSPPNPIYTVSASPNANGYGVLSTALPSTGQYYFDVVLDDGYSTGVGFLGIANTQSAITYGNTSNYKAWYWSGAWYGASSTIVDNASALIAGTYRIAVDRTAGRFYMQRTSGTPSAIRVAALPTGSTLYLTMLAQSGYKAIGVSVSNSGQVLSGTGGLYVNPAVASLAVTDASDTLAATGSAWAKGVLATNDNGDTLSAMGGARAGGSLALADASDSLQASAVAVASGSLATTDATDVMVGIAITSVPATGVLDTTDGPEVVFAYAGVVVSAVVTADDPADTLAGRGRVPWGRRSPQPETWTSQASNPETWVARSSATEAWTPENTNDEEWEPLSVNSPNWSR